MPFEEELMRPITVSLALLWALNASAQSALPTEFPADAKPIAGDALKALFSDRVFKVAHASGSTWRLQYKSDGYYFVNIAPSGFSDSGKWRIEESKICTEPQKSAASCNEVRTLGETLIVKRAVNGEVIRLDPQ
jgi:hypothetical protein